MAKTVLIVEDNEDSRFLAVKVLARHGIEVMEAVGGEEALLIACRVVPDLILMDLGLSGMSGNETAQALRQCEATRCIPIVAFTAYSRQEKGSGLSEALFDGYIEKPIDVRSFACEVESYMKGSGT